MRQPGEPGADRAEPGSTEPRGRFEVLRESPQDGHWLPWDIMGVSWAEHSARTGQGEGAAQILTLAVVKQAVPFQGPSSEGLGDFICPS